MLTGKKPSSGNNRPFSLKATKRRFLPNLMWKRVFNPLTGRMERLRLSAKAIRTIKKWERALLPAEELLTEKISQEGEGKHVKKEKLTPKQKKELKAQEKKSIKESMKTKVAKDMENFVIAKDAPAEGTPKKAKKK